MKTYNRINNKIKLLTLCIAIIVLSGFLFIPDVLGRLRNFYQSCIYGSSSAGSGNEEILSIYPINQNCAIGCGKSCRAAFSSRVFVGPTDLNSAKISQAQMNLMSVELNDSLIYDCMSACQKGESFSAWALSGESVQQSNSEGSYNMLVSKYNSKFSTSETVDSCTKILIDDDGKVAKNADGTLVQNDFVKSKDKNYATDEILISVNDTAEGGDEGKVYMCGRKVVTLTPVFPNIYHIYPTVIEGGDSAILPDLSGTRNKYYDYSMNGFQKSIMDSMIADWNGGDGTYIKPIPNYDCGNLSHDACVTKLNDILMKGIQSKGEWSQSCFSDLPGQMHCLSFMSARMNACAANLYYPPKCTKQHSSTGSNCTAGTTDFLEATQVCLGKKVDSGTADKSPPQGWELTTQQKAVNMVAPRNTHACFVGLSDDQWNHLTNKDIFEYYKTYNKQQYFVPLDADGKPIDLNIVKRVNCFWDYHVRSDIPTKTGVFYKKGDDISITFKGGMIISSDGVNFLDYKSAVMDFFAKSANRKNEIQQMSMMNFKLDGVWHQISGERLRNSRDEEVLKVCDSNTYYGGGKEEGFSSFISQSTVETVTDGKDPIENPDQNTKLPCSYIIRPGQGIYEINTINQETYTSQLNERQEIEVQHPQFYKGGYPISLGGFQVKIDWGGCPILIGDRLQVAYTNNIPRDGDWVDVDLNKSNSQTGQGSSTQNAQYGVKITPKKFFSGIGNYTVGSINDGDNRYLYFRIKPFPQEGFSTNSATMFSTNNRFGHYDIKVHTNHTHIPAGGPLYDLVRAVDRTLFGDDHAQYKPDDPEYQENNQGIIKELFSNTISQSRYANIINIMLILFVILSALAFLIGISHLDTHEGLKRVLKIAFVVALISPSSWELFGVNIVNMFVDGALDIIRKIVGSQYIAQEMNIDMDNDKFAVFAMFNMPISLILSGDTALRLACLLVTSAFGFVVVCIILASSIIYILALVKATVFFVFCLMVESLLIILSPIAIPMILFEQTKQITIKWFKQLISYALQPIFLFSALALFNTMMLVTIRGVFGFTICPKCIIAIPLPLFDDICLLPAYGLMQQMHYPPEVNSMFVLPLASIVASLLFATMGHTMYVLNKISAEIISTLVTGMPSSSSVASLATENVHSSTANAITAIASTAKNFAKTGLQIGRNTVMSMRDDRNNQLKKKRDEINILSSKSALLDKQLNEEDSKENNDNKGSDQEK